MTATEWVLALAALLLAAGVVAALLRPHALAPLVAGQVGILGGVLAVVTLLGGEGRLLAVAAVAAAGAQAGLVLALVRREAADKTGEAPHP
ncbi:MAG: hypothetical protein OXG13_10750 [Gemmatimonadaceae bacterium]|nr:hypothetical protein [Gemmatimonadaceae bacterium]